MVINDGGTGYTNNPSGVNQLLHYYAKISGDGSGAVAKVSVSNGAITEVVVTRPGVGYTYAELIFEAGKVYATEGELDLGINGLNPLGNNNLRTTVVIPPPNGWGSNPARELGGTRVGVFDEPDVSLFPGSFRQIGIITNPTIKTGKVGDIITCSAIKLTSDSIPAGNTYVIGETIEQQREIGGVIKRAKGTVISFENDIIFYIQTPSDVDTDGELVAFGGDTTIKGLTTDLVGTVDRTETGTGVYDTLDFSSGYARGNADAYTGFLNYVTNLSPVTLSTDEQKRITLVISF